jgi:hypothetical protein
MSTTTYCQSLSHWRNSQHFMGPEHASPCSYEPSIGPYPEPDQSSPYHPILSLLRSILILPDPLRLSLPTDFFPSGFPTNILHAFIYVRSHTSYMPCPFPLPSLEHSNYMREALTMQFSPTSYYFISLWSQYSPQRSVLKYLQSTFVFNLCGGTLGTAATTGLLY